MTTTDDGTPIRVSGPEGLLAVVPTMLGFHPSNSLVLMCPANADESARWHVSIYRRATTDRSPPG